MVKNQVNIPSQDIYGSIKFTKNETKTNGTPKTKGQKQDDNIGNKSSKQLDNLTYESKQVILDIKSVFPFDFFQDEIVIDLTKVSIHFHYFFYSKELRSIQFKDIFNVIVQQGLFFASIEIVDKFFSEQPLVVRYLWKKDAIKARRIIQGMMIAQKQNIDIRKIPAKELVRKLEIIGESR
ncbi:hypothetical protein COY14_02250 [Candidatus Roizmanbacteria bacterium CG_4_10_14_0_2_um_filter_36_9]|uniref:Uncharacterized protein n=1 Tax=Candidatus Roizmanbacteria bacterium CG_4_10_14_0_2_um_filter_36_9 TaxID=1974823 RepID=A0A2M7U4A0_9BACT|nr:MAG: hypothetical protein COY14_02250 [Candidatus Roizmanbacteria bacterium CG_4_10_14_0_2_um_filter_36_9]